MLIIAGVIASKVASKIVEPINELDLEKPGENEIYEEVAPLLGKINRQNRQIQKGDRTCSGGKTRKRSSSSG